MPVPILKQGDCLIASVQSALTDADPLLKWYQYSTYASPDDVRLEAMRRIAARPNLDAELVAVLGSENPLWAGEGVRFVADLPITPSPALVDAVRGASARVKNLVNGETT